MKFPALGDNIEGTWARVALPGAGKDAGMAFLPEVDDEVVVGFEHGDTRRPVVLGCAAQRDRQAAREDARRPTTAARSSIYGRKDAEINLQKQLVIDAKEHMTITVESGDDGPGRRASLEARDKFEIKAGTTLKIESTGEMTIKSSAGITVEATGPLKLKGATVDIEASATVNVKGSLINIG